MLSVVRHDDDIDRENMTEHDEIKAAGAILSTALDQYLNQSLTMRNNYLEHKPFTATPPGHSSHAESERQFVEALDSKLQRAKLLIKQARNHSTSLVPIHKLPQELLARIFLIDYNSRPEAISQVCARWRNLAVSLPLLWRHVKFSFNRTPYKTSTTRGKVFASRAHPLPLDVDIYAPIHPEISDDSSIKSLVHGIGPHTGSLVLNATWKGHEIILSSFLSKCEPGVWKSLTTKLDSPFGIFFAAPKTLPDYLLHHYVDVQIGDPAETSHFDRVLASLTTLRLSGYYPYWTGQAYHGLTELRLIRGELLSRNAVISEEHLTGILRASPALRILELSLTIVRALPEESVISPVSLEHLESLNVAQIKSNELGTLLRWIVPGPKPLQLAINLDRDYEPDIAWLDTPNNEVVFFFARSQVSRIYAYCGAYETILKLLNLCPRLETLAWSYLWDSQSHIPEQGGSPIPHPTLESLLIMRSLVQTAPLLSTIGESPALRSILFWGCHYPDGKSSNPLCADNLKALVGLGPKVGIIDYDPTRDWELFAP